MELKLRHNVIMAELEEIKLKIEAATASDPQTARDFEVQVEIAGELAKMLADMLFTERLKRMGLG